MLKAAIHIVVVIQQKEDYIFDAEDVETVLNLLYIDTFYKFDVVIKLL
jgi:hypothetical protein